MTLDPADREHTVGATDADAVRNTPVRAPIEAGHIMQFARALGEQDGPYFAAPGRVVDAVPAPPTFTMALAHHDPAWPLRPTRDEIWPGSGAGDGTALPGNEDGSTSLHAEQHFEYHRPLEAGMTVTATTRPGERWEKRNSRGGLLRFSELVTEYRDETGELVITARSVGVTTGGAQ